MSEHTTTECLLFPDIFDRPVVAKFDQRQGSSDGGAILLKAADRRLGLTSTLAACLKEERQPGKISHEIEELLTQRVMGIALGYEDANDAVRLASDPMHKLLVGRDPIHGEDLASQPTLSRFENAPDRKELFRMSETLADCVIERHRKRLHSRARRTPSIWTLPTIRHTASSSSPFSIATTIATVTCRSSVFSPSTKRQNSTWSRPCCARAMFPAPTVGSAFCRFPSAPSPWTALRGRRQEKTFPLTAPAALAQHIIIVRSARQSE